MAIPVNSHDCMWCASSESGVMRLTRRCLRAFHVSGVDELSKFGLGAAAGPQRDGRPSLDRVTICQMEQDPHPVLRRIFQAGGRERRDMIRNSARVRIETKLGVPPEARRTFESPAVLLYPRRAALSNQVQSSRQHLQARLLNARADQ